MWIKLESLFRKKDDLRGHQLENELISLRPSEFKTIEEFITKFKSLVIFLKRCGIEKKEEQLILSILYNLGLEYLFFVWEYHATKIAVRNWRIPSWMYSYFLSLKRKSRLFKWGLSKPQRTMHLEILNEIIQVQRKAKIAGEEAKVRLQRWRFLLYRWRLEFQEGKQERKITVYL